MNEALVALEHEFSGLYAADWATVDIAGEAAASDCCRRCIQSGRNGS